METRVVAFTGHRSDKLPGGWGGHKEREAMAELLASRLHREGIKRVIVGGALGIDQIAMKAASYAGCHIILVEPFPGFWRKWPIRSIEEYMKLKYSINPAALEIHYSDKDEEYAAWKMQKRNEYMVDMATEVWAYWNGSGGGTHNCIKYAESQNKPITYLYEELNEELARFLAAPQ